MKRRITAMLIVLAMLLGMMSGTAYAATTISSVKLSLNIASIGLNESKKESFVSEAIVKNAVVHTQGLEMDPGNSRLTYWHETYNQLYGFDDTANVKATRQYYANIRLNVLVGCDWGSSIKSLPNMKDVLITKVPGFKVFFNGQERADAYVNYNSYWNSLSILVPIANDVMSGASVTLTSNTFTYDGTIKKLAVESVHPTGGITASLDDCEITCTDMSGNIVTPINVGKYFAAVTLKKGIFGGTKNITFQITKAPNTMTAQGKTVKIKASKLRKKKIIKPTKSLQICNAVGNLKFKLAGVKKKKFKKYFKVNSKNGNITVKKGLKKGKYKLKIDITAAGNANYLAGTKSITVTVRVK